MSSPTGFIPYDTQAVKYVTSIPSNPDSSIVYMLWDGVDASKAVRYEFSGGKLQGDGVTETTLADLGSAQSAGAGAERIITNHPDAKNHIYKSQGDEYIDLSAPKYDVVIYGATPGGIAAAIAAKKQGASAAIFHPTSWIGGMLTGGLSMTDVDPATASHVITGMAKDWLERIGAKWYLPWQQFFRASCNATPKNYQELCLKLLEENKIPVFTNKYLASATKLGTNITRIVFDDFTAAYGTQFIDATYTGDLIAAAGCTTKIGREANTTYSETANGVRDYVGTSNQFTTNIDPYVTAGVPASGLLKGVWSNSYGTLGVSDPYVMAFCYRLCLTNIGSQKIAFTQPVGYNAANYELYGRYIAAEGAAWTALADTMLLNTLQYDNTVVGIKYRVDANSRKAISLNYIDPVCTEYITATKARRAEIEAEIKLWIQGLFWFLLTDSRVPSALKTDVAAWGWCTNEFEATGGFSPELYVREGRRLVGDFVMKESDIAAQSSYTTGVACVFYPIDSHHCRRLYVSGVGVRNEGSGLNSLVSPFVGNPISIKVMWPKVVECTNLQATFAVSASHVAFCSLRMEPTHISLGEAAGVAAAISAKSGITIQNVDINRVQYEIDFLGNRKIGHGALLSSDGTTFTNGTVTKTGTWGTGSPVLGYLGCAHIASSTASSTAKFAPNIKRTGKHKVMINYHDPVSATRGNAVPVTIVHALGTTNLTINQNADGEGGNWLDLGDYLFAKGTPSSHYVQIGVQAEGTSTTIAAVKFLPA